MEISIVIVSWNVSDLLAACLRSIKKYGTKVRYEIIVVDNNSDDGTVGMIKRDFPEVELIVNPNNRGFAVANNQGILKAGGECILLLNPDTEIMGRTLEKALKAMRINPQIGILGCKHFNPDLTLQPSVRRFPKPWPMLLIFLKIAKILPNLPSLNAYYAKDFEYKYEQEVEQVAGSFFLIRRALIDEIGMLDEQFFIWFEEVDFCKRAREANWLVWFTPAPNIIHHGAQSFQQQLTRQKQKRFFESAWYYFKKHGFTR